MNQLFKIFKVDAKEAQQISPAPDEPQTHDYEELIIGIEGKLKHFIDFNSTTFEAPLVSFVTKGKVHRAIPLLNNVKCEMWVLCFKSEFISETTFQRYSSFSAIKSKQIGLYGVCLK